MGYDYSSMNNMNDCLIKPLFKLTHSGRVTHICVDNLTISGSHNGLSSGRRQAITWANAGILSSDP